MESEKVKVISASLLKASLLLAIVSTRENAAIHSSTSHGHRDVGVYRAVTAQKSAYSRIHEQNVNQHGVNTGRHSGPDSLLAQFWMSIAGGNLPLQGYAYG